MPSQSSTSLPPTATRMVASLMPGLDGNGLYDDDNDLKNRIDREERHNQWMLILESFQFFVLGLLIALILEALAAAVFLYVRNCQFVPNKDSGCNSSKGTSPACLDDCNLYPILNLAGENRTMYLKPLDAGNFMPMDAHKGGRKSGSRRRRVYSIAEMCLIRDTAKLGDINIDRRALSQLKFS